MPIGAGHAEESALNEAVPKGLNDNEQHSSTSVSAECQNRPCLIEEYIREDPIDVDLSGLRIFSFDEINDSLEKFGNNVQSLSLKKNLIHDLKKLPYQVAQTLCSLDLYDNKIRRIINLENLTNLVKLDLSYNQIEKIEGLEKLTKLEELYLVENRINDLSGISNLKSLRILELGGNRLRKISSDPLRGLSELRDLYLGKNKISKIDADLSILPKLSTISIAANRLRTIPVNAFGKATSIKQVYLAENGISSIDPVPFHNLKELRILDLSLNPISSLDGMENIGTESLKEFWISSANISSFEEVQRLSQHTKLETVFFEQNPIQKKDSRYFWRIAVLLPQVKMIDLNPVKGHLTDISA